MPFAGKECPALICQGPGIVSLEMVEVAGAMLESGASIGSSDFVSGGLHWRRSCPGSDLSQA